MSIKKKTIFISILSLAFIFGIVRGLEVMAAEFACTYGGVCHTIVADNPTQAETNCFNSTPGAANVGPGACPAPAASTPALADPNVVKLENPLEEDKTDARQIIATVIKSALGIIGALAVLMLVWGGFQWLTSAGNPEKVKMGTQTMVWAIIGVMLVFASFLLLSTFTKILTTGTA